MFPAARRRMHRAGPRRSPTSAPRTRHRHAPVASAAYADAIALASAGWNGDSTTHRRISAPALASAATSSTSRCARRDAIFPARSLCDQEFAKRRRGGCEAAGHADARVAELPDHFAERRVLAADLVDVGHAQTLEGNDEGRLGHGSTFALRAAVQFAPRDGAALLMLLPVTERWVTRLVRRGKTALEPPAF